MAEATTFKRDDGACDDGDSDGTCNDELWLWWWWGGGRWGAGAGVRGGAGVGVRGWTEGWRAGEEQEYRSRK